MLMISDNIISKFNQTEMSKFRIQNQEHSDQQQYQKQQTNTYRQQLQRLMEQLQRTTNQCKQLNVLIQTQLDQIEESALKSQNKIKEETKTYYNSLEPQYNSQKIINLASLSKYLNSQKTFLKQLLSDNQNAQQKLPSTLLHDLLKRKHFFNYLQQFECKKIQAEIQYLQKNILLGNGILYEGLQTFTLAEEQNVKIKILTGIQQLQRIVNLSNSCEGYQNKQAKTKNKQLLKQAKRLQQIDNILSKQYDTIKQLKQYDKTIEGSFKPIFDFLQSYKDKQNNLTK